MNVLRPGQQHRTVDTISALHTAVETASWDCDVDRRYQRLEKGWHSVADHLHDAQVAAAVEELKAQLQKAAHCCFGPGSFSWHVVLIVGVSGRNGRARGSSACQRS